MEFQHPLQRQREFKISLRGQAIYARLRDVIPASVSDKDLVAVLEVWQQTRQHRVGLRGWTPAEAKRQADQLADLPEEHRIEALRLAAKRGAVVMTGSNYVRHVNKLRTGKALPWVRKPTLP